MFIVLSGGDDNGKSSSPSTTTAQSTTGKAESPNPPTARPKPAAIEVRNAKPVGGVERLEYTKGDQVRFVVRSDVADEIHVHGYDIKKDVTAGGQVSFDFPAKIEGVFEVELESRSEEIAELRVNP
jgi:hypothetical protein